MYYPAATHLHYLEAQGILELHRMQWLMERGQHVHACDPYEPIRRLAMVENASRNPKKQLTSFRINDILDQKGQHGKVKNNACGTLLEHEHDHKRIGEPLEDSDFSESSGECSSWNNNDASYKTNSVLSSHKIIRPWSTSPLSSESDDTKTNTFRHKSHDSNRKHIHYSSGTKRLRLESEVSSDEEEIDVEGCDDNTVDSRTDSICTRGLQSSDLSPLGALVAMSSKTFIGLESFESQRNREHDKHKSQSPKKKRKTRTAFTNQQIYELERRFILQKYLTPADRDEIAGRLGLTCAQVITWFQNRRAKFKRDIEEMKNDVVATSPKDPNIGKNE